MYLSAQWLVDRDIIYLKNNEEVESTVEPDSHGQHFIIDLRELEYDSDVYIGIHKLNEPNTSLTVDLSLTVPSWMVCELVLRRRRVGHREVERRWAARRCVSGACTVKRAASTWARCTTCA